MAVPILSTKLNIPPLRSKYVSRSNLVEKLNESLASGSKLIILSAPAGFGKTTLVCEWAAACGRPLAWLSLDDSDSTSTGFLAYLVSALQTVQAGVGETVLAALQSAQPPSVAPLLIELVNEISATSISFILVLDDYHLVDSKDVDQALSFLVENQPPQMHLVIISREDPPLALSRLRAKGQLTELRADDLRFTLNEASDFLNRVMSLNLASNDISILDKHVEGWAVGLQLAALSLQRDNDPSTFIRSFTGSHHFILDYLVEEVLYRQPENTQQFLLKTSILNRLCGPLCEAVINNPGENGQDTLEALDHDNLFITTLDHERRWYRYHNLFRDLLQKQLGQFLSPEEINQSHLRASQWYEANGDFVEAFDHALAAADYHRGAELAEGAYRNMDDKFLSAAWLVQVRMLPDSIMSVHPLLCVQAGMAYTDAGDLEASEAYLSKAEHCLVQVGKSDQYPSLPGMIALGRAFNAQLRGDIHEVVKYAELSLELIPESDFFQRSQANVTLGFSNWAAGNLEAALRVMTDWMENLQKTGNTVFVVASAFAVADILVGLGRLMEAESSLNRSLELASTQGDEAEKITAHHYLILSQIAYERSEHELYLKRLQMVHKLKDHTTLVDWPYCWNLAQALIKEREQDFEAALKLLDEAKSVYVRNPVPDLRPVDAIKARIYLKQGRLDKARTWVNGRGLSVSDEIDYLGEFEHLVLARIRIAEHDYSGINSMLERILAAAEAQNRLWSVLEILLTLFLSCQTQGDQQQANIVLNQALIIAEPEGYIRIFVDEGEPMRLQLETLAKDRNHPLRKYLFKLLSAFSRSTANSQQTGLIEPLTARELEILRLVAQGLSNSEISRRLFLSVSTIKGHNLRIFDKLQAQNRTEAVASARDLGLL